MIKFKLGHRGFQRRNTVQTMKHIWISCTLVQEKWGIGCTGNMVEFSNKHGHVLGYIYMLCRWLYILNQPDVTKRNGVALLLEHITYMKLIINQQCSENILEWSFRMIAPSNNTIYIYDHQPRGFRDSQLPKITCCTLVVWKQRSSQSVRLNGSRPAFQLHLFHRGKVGWWEERAGKGTCLVVHPIFRYI